MTPVIVYPSYPQTLGMTLRFVLADLVFLTREDIRVVIVDDGLYMMRQQPFYDG
jgi:hypothetical protein